MIAAMKKFFLVLLDKDVHKAPLHLRRLGIAHLEKFASSGETCAGLEENLKNAMNAKALLSSNANRKNGKKPSENMAASRLIESTLAVQAEMGSLQDRILELRRETDRIRDWGDFSPELFDAVTRSGLRLTLLEGQPRNMTGLDETLEYLLLPAPKGKARIALLGASRIPDGFEEFRLPAKGLSLLEREILDCEKAVDGKRAELTRLALDAALLDGEIAKIEYSLVIERLRAGMPQHDSMRYLTGYVPAREVDALKKEAASRGWGLVLDDPAEGDMPPTKVENHPAVRIIQPVFDFLGTVPGYREYDISSWFIIFFSLYFAMIFGDGGYGLIMLAGALFASVKILRQRKPLPDFLKLVFVLSAATILWGLLTGSWFALSFDSLPSFLRAATIPAFAVDNPESGTNIKIFCFIIGALQLSIAHLKNIRRDFPNLKFLAQVGSLTLVIGMFNAVLNLVVDATRFPLTTPALALIGAGFFLVLFFGNWNGNLLKSVIEGLKGIIPTFLSTVSVFADIVSYIRLWAVSLAGLAISQTINGMVGKMVGNSAGRIMAFLVGLVAAFGLLLAGHALNFLMTVLSVVVHGIRLNMLEFSSHLGMEWTGYAYEPLIERAEDNETQE